MQNKGKILLWDLGNTLLEANTLNFAKEIGLLDFILYPCLEWKNPKKIYHIAFDFLDSLSVPHTEPCHATAQGRPLPAVLCHWLKGSVDQASVSRYIEEPFLEWVKKGSFSSKRQARLVYNTLKTLFNPVAFAQCMRLIEPAMTLVKECAEQYDTQGNPRHTLLILSNWDPYSFNNLTHSLHMQELFYYFKYNVVSGNIGMLKPEKAIYEYILTAYKFNAADCILIDDQYENIQGAQAVGMAGIHLQNGDYKSVRNELNAHNVIP